MHKAAITRILSWSRHGGRMCFTCKTELYYPWAMYLTKCCAKPIIIVSVFPCHRQIGHKHSLLGEGNTRLYFFKKYFCFVLCRVALLAGTVTDLLVTRRCWIGVGVNSKWGWILVAVPMMYLTMLNLCGLPCRLSEQPTTPYTWANEYGGWVKIVIRFRPSHKPRG